MPFFFYPLKSHGLGLWAHSQFPRIMDRTAHCRALIYSPLTHFITHTPIAICLNILTNQASQIKATKKNFYFLSQISLPSSEYGSIIFPVVQSKNLKLSWIFVSFSFPSLTSDLLAKYNFQNEIWISIFLTSLLPSWSKLQPSSPKSLNSFYRFSLLYLIPP